MQSVAPRQLGVTEELQGEPFSVPSACLHRAVLLQNTGQSHVLGSGQPWKTRLKILIAISVSLCSSDPLSTT